MVLAEVLYLFAVPFVLNNAISDGSFSKFLKAETGLEVRADYFKFSTCPDFSLKFIAKNLKLTDKKDYEVAAADNISAKIRILPILFKRLSLPEFGMNSAKGTVVRDKKGDFYLGTYKIPQKAGDMKISKFRGKISESKLNFVDENAGKNITLSFNGVNVRDFSEKKHISLSANITVDADSEKSFLDIDINTKIPVLKFIDRKDFFIKGKIKNFDISPYSIYASELSGNKIKSLNGIINADFDFSKKSVFSASINEPAVIFKNNGESVFANGITDINFNGFIGHQKLDISMLKINNSDWQFDISGRVKNITGKNPNMDLNIKIPSSNLHSLINLLPATPGTNHAVEKLKKYGVWGEMISELALKGTLKKPLIYGKSQLSNLHILKEEPIVAPCAMDLEFTGKHVNLYTKVFADKQKLQYVTVEGFSELKPFGAGEIKIKSTGDVDLKTAHYMLVPIHDIVGFDLGPLPYMSISGRGNIDMTTKGTVFDGEASGEFRFNNTNAVLKGLNTRIEKAQGYLLFKGKDMLFDMEKAQIRGCPVSVKGTAKLDGHIDFKIHSPSIVTEELVSIVNGSELLKSKKVFTEKIEKNNGYSKVDIELKGVVKNFSDLKDVSDLDFSGNVFLKNNTAYIKGLPDVHNVNGKIFFDNKDASVDISSKVFDSMIYLKAELKDNEKADVKLKADRLKIDELIDYLLNTDGRTNRFPKTNSILSFEAKYKGNPYKINFRNITANGHIKPANTRSKDDLFIKSGDFSLKNNTFRLKNFDTAIFNTTAHADMVINNVLGASPSFNGNLTVVNFNISNFNKLRNMKMLPQSLKKALLAYENYEGTADIRLSCVNNKVSGEIRLLGLKFLQSAYKIPISIDSGNIYINNNKITLKSINANFDNVPIFINAYVNGLSRNSEMTGYFTTKVTESFVNKYINERLSYPIKPKGDITLTAEISGIPEKYNVETKLRLEKEADIYYMGANLDDTNEDREINADISVSGDNIKINSLNYIRYMTSQNDYVYPRRIIKVFGDIKRDKNKFFFNNLHILTENNANVKLFNVLFKKSVLKKGMFNCNLILNGDAAAPKVLGQAGMIELDMPLYTTLIKDVSMQFTPSVVNVKMNGMSYDSDFVLKTVINNRPALPVVVDTLKISSKSLELDNILDSLNQVTLNTGIKLDDDADIMAKNEKKQNEMLSNIIIKKGEISAERMKVRGLPAKNYKAVFKLDRDLVLKVENLTFEIAEGFVQGLAKYDFKTGKISAEVMAKHVDANKIATAIFEAKDQIFGYLNGSMMFSTRGTTEEERLNNISGTVYFELNDGKMPKLGSVEYLLKASSLFKSGITGVSINNFIDLIAPVKTGYFNSIRGLLLISHGKAKNVEIFSSGDNLSMYIKGTYDIPESFADLNVYGRLTKKADNILGPVGNMSFNSLLNLIPGFKLDRRDKTAIIKELNKIPGVEFNDMQYRIFNAKIHGNINSDKYVKYFKWIE